MPNDNNDTNLETWHDPELEARLVAMALGEASDYERAELERLMDEQPGLAKFYANLQWMDGLLDQSEGTTPQPADWKLAPEKRQKLLGHFAENADKAETVTESAPVSDEPVTPPAQKRFPWMGRAVAVAAVVMISAVSAPILLQTASDKSAMEAAERFDSNEKSDGGAQPTEFHVFRESGSEFDSEGELPSMQPLYYEASGADTNRFFKDSGVTGESLFNRELAAAAATPAPSSDRLAPMGEVTASFGYQVPTPTERTDDLMSIADATTATARDKLSSLAAVAPEPSPVAPAAPVAVTRPKSHSLSVGTNYRADLSEEKEVRYKRPLEDETLDLAGTITSKSGQLGDLAGSDDDPFGSDFGDVDGFVGMDTNSNSSGLGTSYGFGNTNGKYDWAGPASGENTTWAYTDPTTATRGWEEQALARSSEQWFSGSDQGGAVAFGSGAFPVTPANPTVSIDISNRSNFGIITDSETEKGKSGTWSGYGGPRTFAGGGTAGDGRDGLADLDDFTFVPPPLDSSVATGTFPTTAGMRFGLEAGGESFPALDPASGSNYRFRAALEKIPDAPLLMDKRKEIATLEALSKTKLAHQRAQEGRRGEARELLEEVLEESESAEARKVLANLDDPEYYSHALTPKHAENIAAVDLQLKIARGYYDLGDFDNADRAYNATLRLDRYNTTARRGQQEVEFARREQHSNSKDHTRSHLLRKVDEGWETAVPLLAVEQDQELPKLAKPSGAPIFDREFLGGANDLAGYAFRSDTASLESQIAEQNDKLETARVAMLDTMEKHGIVDLDAGQPSWMTGGEPTTGRGALVMSAEQAEFSAEAAIQDYRTTLDTLKDLEGDELIRTAVELGINNPTLTTRYPQLQSLQLQKASALETGLKPTDPKVVELAKQEAILKGMLNDAVETTQSALQTKLAMAEQTFANTKDTKGGTENETLRTRRASFEYAERKKAYELEKERLNSMQSMLAKQRVAKEQLAKLSEAAPHQALLDLETATSAQAFSTFSLNVSDVSFKLAETALLENSQWPEAGKVRPEEFLNAFHYCDPLPSLKDRVAATTEQCAHPFLQQRNLLRISMSTAALGRAADTPLRLTVLLDKSGSMEREDREASVTRAFAALAGQLRAGDVITVIGFARTASLIADRLPAERANELVRLVAEAPSAGGTNLEEALRLASESAERQFLGSAQNRIVLITDGAANLGDADPASLQQKIITLRDRGIAFDACGVGADGFNDEILEAMTRKGDGRYYFLDRPEDADANFIRQLAGALRPAAKNVKVQVEFNPQRVSAYRLSGFEKHRLKKQDFRNDAVDAAEMAAEESGNALYQIELDPSGSGDVGRVFVRFLDLASGQMVERSWKIPYQPSAPRLQDAPAPLQLAVTATMLAEKLKGGPVADSIDLSQLAPIATALRGGALGRDERVQRFIQMIEKARTLQP